jgi:hypothetical protein
MDHKFNIITGPSETPWDKMIQILDVVGMRPFSKVLPDKNNFEIRNSINPDGGYDLIVICNAARAYFEFTNKWAAHYSDLDTELRIVDKRPVVGQLVSAFPYIEKLLELGVIALENTQLTNINTHKQLKIA